MSSSSQEHGDLLGRPLYHIDDTKKPCIIATAHNTQNGNASISILIPRALRHSATVSTTRRKSMPLLTTMVTPSNHHHHYRCKRYGRAPGHINININININSNSNTATPTPHDGTKRGGCPFTLLLRIPPLQDEIRACSTAYDQSVRRGRQR